MTSCDQELARLGDLVRRQSALIRDASALILDLVQRVNSLEADRKQRQLASLREYMDEFEKEHGPIPQEDLDAARAAWDEPVVVPHTVEESTTFHPNGYVSVVWACKVSGWVGNSGPQSNLHMARVILARRYEKNGPLGDLD